MRRKTFALAALALFGFAAGAAAQDFNRDLRDAQNEQRPPTRSGPLEGQAVTETVTRTARYRVEILEFYADDETGSTNVGSDEIIIVFSGYGYRLAGRKYEGVDNRERRVVPANQRCLYPAYDPDQTWNRDWRCRSEGAPGPLNFRLSLREHDGALLPQSCVYAETDILQPGDDLCELRSNESHQIGSYWVRMSEAELAEAMPAPTRTMDRYLWIGGGCPNGRDGGHYCVGDEPSDATYAMKIRITRMADLVTRTPLIVLEPVR